MITPREQLLKKLKIDGNKITLDILKKIMYNIRESYINNLIIENDAQKIFEIKGKLVLIDDIIQILEVKDGN